MLEEQPPASNFEFPDLAETSMDRKAADVLVERAESAPLTDGGLEVSQLLSEALLYAPHHHDAHLMQEQLHQMFVPRWHFPMLADTDRNRAYAQAIAAKVKPGDVVLDIGCGAGLTAMLAARAGAKHVYACEQQPLIAAAATRVIAANGLSDRITVIPKWSHNIVVGVDMPEQADVVVSEIVDSNLLGEGALDTLKFAMARLAKPDARAIPERGTLKAQLVESEALLNQLKPAYAEGFDLSAFHQYATVAQVTPNDSAACSLLPLGPTSDLFHFDFTKPDTTPGSITTELTSSFNGTLHAVVAIFDMELAPGISVTNALHVDGHWGRTAYLMDAATPVSVGSKVTITAQHDATRLSLSVHDVASQRAQPAPEDRRQSGKHMRPSTARSLEKSSALRDEEWYLPEMPAATGTKLPVH